MSLPLFPSLHPRSVDPIWFTVDKPCDDEIELNKLEEEHQKMLQSIGETDQKTVPIGRTAPEYEEEEEEEEDEDADDDEESDTNDDELEDMMDERNSTDDADMDYT